MHFARPRPFQRIVPPWLGDPAPWVAVSGAAELACAAGLAMPRTRRSAALGTAALFVAVFPANVQMALDARSGPLWYRVGAWARLPLQVPLVLWALSVSGEPSTARAGRRPR